MIAALVWTWMLGSVLAAEPDLDGDGWPAATDCDDADAAVNPDADESCNEIDDDCDGLADDDDDDERVIGSHWAWFDGDGDRLGSTAYASFCVRPSGWVRRSGDCDDTDPTIGERVGSHPDADADGHGAIGSGHSSCTIPSGYVVDGSDCDDGDPAINPSAPEVCNDIDDNCDEVVDEDDPFLVGTTFYEDDDRDGYGDDLATDSTGCEVPYDFVAVGGDCDPADVATHPGAPELCDGEDNDCDTEVDESVMDVDWYVDADGDGFGEPSDVLNDCARPAGYAYTDDDCDDADVSVSPIADETCGNWIDDDCDGARDECTLVAEDVADFVVSATIASTGFGDALATGDADGDGWADLVVGAPSWDPRGAAFLFHGPLTGAATTNDADFVVTTARGADLGDSVALGDADGDGHGDLLVGAPNTGLAGSAYVFHGPLTGSVDTADADAVFGSDTLFYMSAGQSVSIVPDHTGDGVADLIVGAPGDNYRGGTVYVFSGTITGTRGLITDSSCAYKHDNNHDRTGESVTSLGDHNGDGLEDILIGAPYKRHAYVVEGGEPRGRHYLPEVAAAVLNGRGGFAARFGTDVAAGDLDGDGHADAVISAPYPFDPADPFDPAPEDGGVVYAFLGPLSGGISAHDAVARWESDGGRSSGFGWSVATGGDVDGDGTTDVLIGDPWDEIVPQGTVFLQLGPASGVIDDSALTSFRSSERDYLGWDVALVPDWTGDGRPEIAAGAPQATGDTGVAVGSVSVFFSDSLFE